MAVIGSMPFVGSYCWYSSGKSWQKRRECCDGIYATSLVMFASFPDAKIRPLFVLDGSQKRCPKMVEQDCEIFAEELVIAGDQHWKSINVYATGTSAAMVDIFVSAI